LITFCLPTTRQLDALWNVTVLDCTQLLKFRMPTMITISKEDYLKAIAEAEAEGQMLSPLPLLIGFP